MRRKNVIANVDTREHNEFAEDREPLLGRAIECALLEEMWGDVLSGRSRCLVVDGEAGIGKTTLLDWLRTAVSHNRGALVLSTSGGLTAVLPYFALSELLAQCPPVDGLPPSFATTLAMVTGGVGRLDSVGPEQMYDPLFVGAAALRLLTTVAENRPVLLTIDDAQWIDESSADALSFIARRVDTDAVAIVVARRSGEPCRFPAHGLERFVLNGMSTEASLELIEKHVPADVAREIVARTMGNPLAILQAVNALALPEADVVDMTTVRDASASYQHTLRTLTNDARLAILVAACDERLERALLVRASEALGALDGELALTRCENASLLQETRHGVALAHPLVRNAIEQIVPRAAIPAAHVAIAGLLKREGDIERRAWHLAAAADAPDALAVYALEAAAARAEYRGDSYAAGIALQRAAELAPDDADAVRCYTSAGEAFSIATQMSAAMQAYDEVLTRTSDPEARLEVHRRRAVLSPMIGSASALFAEMTEEREQLAATNPTAAAALAAYSILPAFSTGDLGEARACLERARELDPCPSEIVTGMLAALDPIVRVFEGDVASACPELLAFAGFFDASPIDPATADLVGYVANALGWMDEFDTASSLLDRLVQTFRSMGGPGGVSYPLVVRAELRCRTGHVIDARADADEGLALATTVDRASVAAYGLLTRARADAMIGAWDLARESAVEAVQAADADDFGWIRLWARATLGFALLAAGAPDAAIEPLEWCSTFAESRGIRLMTPAPWGPELVEAYILLRRHEDAARLTARLEREAGDAPTQLVRALLARCAGLLADDSNFNTQFKHALALHAEVLAPFETARTHLCYGQRLLRTGEAKGVAAGRRQLEQAAVLFGSMGAVGWRDRGRREVGPSPAGMDDPELTGLTTQEHHVAAAVARGATNRQIAEELFLSVRTVESHLANTYRKLGVHSRTQLVNKLSGTQNP